jgi:uncharacterized membrane protein YheB (UPF0754 family)
MFSYPHFLRFIAYPIIGSLLGSLTNYIAIRLLFRPRRKILGIQGLLAKRKPEIAERAGEIVNSYLVNSEEIRKQINEKRVHRAVEQFLEKFLKNNTGILIEIPFMKRIVRRIVSSLMLDHDGYLSRNIINSVVEPDMVSDIVKQKINEFDVTVIESLFRKASGPEINFIIMSGAILGFLIGLVEAFIGL